MYLQNPAIGLVILVCIILLSVIILHNVSNTAGLEPTVAFALLYGVEMRPIIHETIVAGPQVEYPAALIHYPIQTGDVCAPGSNINSVKWRWEMGKDSLATQNGPLIPGGPRMLHGFVRGKN